MSTDAPAWLTVDRGNSTLDCMWLGGDRARLEPTAAAFEEFLGGRRPDCTAAVSVVADGLDPVRDVLGADAPLLRAGDELPCPLALEYDTPETLGADRWVAACGAWRRVGTAIVVDCGTAVTVDAVTEDGRFLGGAIAPGAATMAFGLTERAPALPEPSLTADVELPPRTSQAAVDVGVQLGFVGLVERLIAGLESAVGFQDPHVVLTGGGREILERFSSRRFVVAPDLVHAGLRCLLRIRESNS